MIFDNVLLRLAAGWWVFRHLMREYLKDQTASTRDDSTYTQKSSVCGSQMDYNVNPRVWEFCLKPGPWAIVAKPMTHTRSQDPGLNDVGSW
jgi:hypothetical protein